MDKKILENQRQEYGGVSLSEKDVNKNPFIQFQEWFTHAMNGDILEPNAFTLSTVSKDGVHSRVMLLKGLENDGFTFFTNYESEKGENIKNNPKVCMSFFWLTQQRQIIIEGVAEKISREESVRYFQSRPKGSQLGAWCSNQSKVIAGREVLEDRLNILEEQYKDVDTLPCPDYWGGYLVKPTKIEFWQGGARRLHDRVQYIKQGENWLIQRVSP